MSVPPPGAAGTTTLTGLLGYCAEAVRTNDTSIAPARKVPRTLPRIMPRIVRSIIANPPGPRTLTGAAVAFFPHSGDHSVIRNVRAPLPHCQYPSWVRQIDVRRRIRGNADEPCRGSGIRPIAGQGARGHRIL